jgi:hypothetical protein
MKKVLIVLLILAVAGGLFAQEVSFSGIVETGLQIKKDDGKAGKAGLWNDNDGVGSRARIQGTYDADTYGAKVGIGTDFDPSATVSVYNAYAWYNFLNNVINAKAGLIDDGVWTTGGPEDWGLATGAGVRVEVTPIEGLNVGLFLTNSGDISPFVGSGGGDIAGDFLKETAFGASYTSDLFDVSLTFKLDSEADDETVDNDGDNVADWVVHEDRKPGNAAKPNYAGLTSPIDTDIAHEAILGFAFKGLPALTAKAEVRASALGAFSDVGTIWANEDVAYRVLEPLNVGAVITEYYYVNTDAAKLFLQVKPYVEYQVNEPISVGLEVPVYFQDKYTKLGLGGKPWVKYAFSDDAYIKAFYNLDYRKPDGADAVTNHTVQLDFVVSF